MATVSVDAGGTVVTGVGTAFEAYDGDLLILSSEAIPILRVDSPSQLVLKYPWPNTAVIDSQDFAIAKTGQYWRDTINVISAVNTLLDKVNKGLPFSIGAAGPLTSRSAYDTEAAGFVYLASDPPPARVYVKTGPTSSAWTRGIVVEGVATIPGAGGPGGVPQPGGTTYFVSASGNDSNDGITTGTPWKSIDKVNNTAFKPGDVIAFRGGDTFSGTLTCSAAATSAGRIKYCAYGQGRPTISAGPNKAVYGLNTPYVDVQDIVVQGAAGNATHGVHFEASLPGDVKIPGPHIENVSVSGFGFNGIFVQGTNGASGFDGAQVRFCTVDDCTKNATTSAGSCGIYFRSGPAYTAQIRAHTNALVEHCRVTQCPGTPGCDNWTGSGILLAQCLNSISRFNETSYNGQLGNAAGGGPVGNWAYDSTGITFERNIGHHNYGAAQRTSDGGAIDLDAGCVNCIVRYNLSYMNDGYGVALYSYTDNLQTNIGHLIHHNLSILDGQSGNLGGFFVRNDDSKIIGGDLFSNTIVYDKGRAALWVERAGGAGEIRLRVANNILLTMNPNGHSLVEINASSTIALLGNAYRSGGYIASWSGTSWKFLSSFLISAFNQERINGNIIASGYDPQFVGQIGSFDPEDYKLSPGSALGSVGVDLNALLGVDLGEDYFGNDVFLGSAPSIGFHEIVGGPELTEAEITATYTFSGPTSSGYADPTADATKLRNGTYTADSTWKTDRDGTSSVPNSITAFIGSPMTLTGVRLGCEAFAQHLNGCSVLVSADGQQWENCGQVWEAAPGQTHHFALGRRAGMAYIRLEKGWDFGASTNESRKLAVAEFRPLGY